MRYSDTNHSGNKTRCPFSPALFNIYIDEENAICQSVAGVQLTGLAPLGAVSHRFNFLIFLIDEENKQWTENYII